MNTIQQEINEVIRNLQALDGAIKRTIREDLKGPASLLASAIKARTPIGPKKHSRYKRITKKSKRMPKGQGVIVATYRPGNLQKSFRILGLRRVRNAQIVGPLLGGKRNDGYYAHWVNDGVIMTNGKVRTGLKFVEAAIIAAGPIALRATLSILSGKLQQVNRAGNMAGGSNNWAKAYARAKMRE